MDDVYIRHLQRAQLLIERHRFKEAEIELRAAAAIHPDVGEVHTSLADCIVRQKNPARYQEAQQEAHCGVMHDPENAMAYYVLAQCLCALDQLKAAEKVLRKTVELAPDDADCHAILGVVLLDLGRLDEAKKEFRITLSLAPENRWGLYFSTIIENAKGNRNEAAKYTRQLLQVAPDEAESHIALGQLLAQTGIDQSAENAFREALRIDPNNRDAYVGLLKAQKGIASKGFLFFLEFVHCLFRYRLVLILVFAAVTISLMRSCSWMEVKPEKSVTPYVLPDQGQQKMTHEEFMRYIRHLDKHEKLE